MSAGAVVQGIVHRKAVWGAHVRLLAVLGVAALSASCGQMARQGEGSSYLIVTSLQGASGAAPDEFGGTMFSDVITVVKGDGGALVPTVFSDLGRVSFTLALKDPGPAGAPTTPTPNNYITINRYHVQYIRADGRNTPGVDVPYPFDGAMTLTVAAGEVTSGFEIVRHVAKEEAPLKALAVNQTIITTIGEVTFYGRDQTGREASVTARILIEFGNFGDPQ
jgi:hypothetical protein